MRVRRDWSNRIYRLDQRLSPLLRRVAEGLDAHAIGGAYDDIVLRGDAMAGSWHGEEADDPTPTCWCMQKVAEEHPF